MATVKITQLPPISGASADATDVLPLVDVSSNITNKITRQEFFNNIPSATFSGDLTIADKIVHSGDTNTSIRFPAADTVTVETSGVERLRIDSSGNVGIGTSSPSNRLDLYSAGNTLAAVSNASGGSGYFGLVDAVLRLTNLNASSETAVLGNGQITIRTAGGSPIVLGTSDAERMRLDASGNLGLGVTPSAWGNSGYSVFNAKGNAAFIGLNAGGINTQTIVANNFYDAGLGSPTYMASNYATNYTQFQGQHIWNIAPSGTAGNAITFTQAMTLNASGQLILGGSTPSGSAKITVNGAATETTLIGTNGSIEAFFNGGAGTTVSLMGTTGNFPLGFYTNGSERARIDASGNLLVGTTTAPSSNGKGLAIYDATFPRLTFRNSTTGDGTADGTQIVQDGLQFRIANLEAGNVEIYTAGSERARIDASGNLGLGVTPSAWGSNSKAFQFTRGASTGSLASILTSDEVFVLRNAYHDNTNFRYVASTLATSYQQSSDGKHLWFTAPSGTAGNPITFTQAMTLDASGNLEVRSVSGNGTLTLTSNAATYSSVLNLNSSSGGVSLINASQVLRFDTNGSERARIDSSGNLLVGTTSDIGGLGGRLQIASGGSRGIVQSLNANVRMQEYLVSGSTVGFISNNGTATTYATSSDYRLKENVQPMQNALDTVAQLNPVTYTWKADGSAGQGFIAHELQAVVPDCVTGEKDAVDAEGNPQYQGVDTSFLVATLVKAIQEQQTTIAALEARITALEA